MLMNETGDILPFQDSEQRDEIKHWNIETTRSGEKYPLYV